MRDHLGKNSFRKPSARSLSAFLLVAGGILTFALVVDRFAGAPARRDRAAAAILFPLAAPEAPGIKPGPPESGLFGLVEGESPLTFDEFMGYLEDMSRDPEVAPQAREFVKAFNETPELERLHGQFRRMSESGQKPSAVKFAAALRAEPAFRQLVARFLGNPQSSAFLGSGGFPELAELAKAYQEARGAAAAAGPGRAPAAAASGRPPTFDEARKSVLDSLEGGQAVSKAGGVPATPGTFLGGAGPGAGAGAALAGPSGTRAAAPGGAPAGSEGRLGGPPPGGGGPGGGSGAGATQPLKDVKQVTPNAKLAKLLELYPFLAKNFSPAELEKLSSDIDRHGLWGACFSNRWVRRCVDACRDAGPSCELPPTLWEACEEAFGDLRCLALCKEQPPCAVPAEAMLELCDPKASSRPAECGPTQPKPDDPAKPEPPACVLSNGCYKDMDAGGFCCFDQGCALVHSSGGAWPRGSQPCSGKVEPLGKCASNPAGTCCWEESTSRILFESIPNRSCSVVGPAGSCGFPYCCRQDKPGCCFDREGRLHPDSPPACLAPAPRAPGAVPAPAGSRTDGGAGPSKAPTCDAAGCCYDDQGLVAGSPDSCPR